MEINNKKPTFFKYGFLSALLGKFGESMYLLNALMVALGASAFQIGVINGVRTFGMIFSQFVGLWFVNLFSSRRKSEIIAMVIIELPKLILIYIAFLQNQYWFGLIVIVVFLKGLLGQASYLCWFTWMSLIVPEKFRDYFFGTRNFFGQIGRIIGFILAALILKLDYPVLFLLGFLLIFSYIFYGIGETSMYFFHPDSKRKILAKNHILKRMKQTFKEKRFVNFLFWFAILSGVLTVNVLYLEYFMIHNLGLSYLWIPVSFIVISLSSAIAFYFLRSFFPKINYQQKRSFINLIILISSISWFLVDNVCFLVLSLFLAGFSLGALTLSEKVDLIQVVKSNDKEAFYAVFKFFTSVFITIIIFFLNAFQFFEFNFYLVFLITAPLTLINFIFIFTSSD